jgi:hypothetical protein
MRPGRRKSVRTSTVPYLTTDTDPDQRSDTVADRSGERTHPANGLSGVTWSADRHGPPPDNGSPPDTNGDPSATVSGRQRPLRSWPLLILAAPAAVAVWSGWVGIGQMTGFGEIRPLPGIWNSLHVDTAVTLPIGVEAYAAFALRAWLTRNSAVSDRTRRFARWSAIAALVLGMAGQVAYHLLTQAGVTRAPWEVTTVVSCLPVAVLGMGSALAHLLRSDASAAVEQARFAALQTSEPASARQPHRRLHHRPQTSRTGHTGSPHPMIGARWRRPRLLVPAGCSATPRPSNRPKPVLRRRTRSGRPTWRRPGAASHRSIRWSDQPGRDSEPGRRPGETPGCDLAGGPGGEPGAGTAPQP